MNKNNMTQAEIQLVRRTFEMVTTLADTFALIFYDRLFFIAPQLRPLFQTEMTLQREKLMSMMALIVRGLDQPEFFVKELRQMGLRHASYRVEPEHYPIINEAIIWALSECLGEMITAEMSTAWEKVLDMVTDVMLEGSTRSV